ncbi:hypothetical protein [Nocardia sp. alder85J]|uniref:hypothetical protein n=1 Tax=Nocardia sp. alder85J TaxID=2862949 RepID=UPI001CD44F36|nr:hypothetical protein [Nocardia sp. alder85J]MCX4093890.1 hypothetical protein [Nocardia sp. alder85J]
MDVFRLTAYRTRRGRPPHDADATREISGDNEYAMAPADSAATGCPDTVEPRRPAADPPQVPPRPADDEPEGRWGQHMADLLREWMRVRAAATAGAVRPVPEPAEQRLARLLTEALRAQSDSHHDTPYVGPDLPDDILLRGWFDLARPAKILAVAWPRPLPWRRRQMLVPLLTAALQRQAATRDGAASVSPALPEHVLLDGWWDLEAAVGHVLTALSPRAVTGRATPRFLTGSPNRRAAV